MVGVLLGAMVVKTFFKDMKGYGIGRTLIVDSKVLNKSTKCCGNSRESYPRTKLYGLTDELFKSNQSKCIDLRENPKEKNHGTREGEDSTIVKRKLQWWKLDLVS